MNKKKTKQESAVLVFFTIAVIAAIGLFAVKIWFPEFIDRDKKDYGDSEYYEEESDVPEVTIEQLKDMMDTASRTGEERDFIILDVQNIDNHIESTIPTSINIPLIDLDLRFEELPRNKEIIVIDAGSNCQECVRGTEMLLANDFNDVKKLDGGVSTWFAAGYPVLTGRDVTYQNLNARGLMDRIEAQEDIIILDVREKDLYDISRIPGAEHLEFENLSEELLTYSKEADIIVYDESGNRSKVVVEQFINQGYNNVLNMIDGIKGWVDKEYSVEN